MHFSDFENAFTKAGGQGFFIRILFRQNASYQGEICWMEEGKSLYFRSLLEMIMLLQEALDEAGVPKADYTFKTWKGGIGQEEIS